MKKNIVLFLIVSAVFIFSARQNVQALDESTDIVFVIDVSGSMDQADRGRFAKDALNLGIDLSPQNSRIAIVSVNYVVVSETSLMDSSSVYGRNYLKNFVMGLQNRDHTNFTPGYERALEILYSSTATNKRIIFIGDFDEGGFNVWNLAQESEVAARIDTLGEIARERGVIIDSVMWRNAPANSITASHFLELPQSTGGTSFQIYESNQAPHNY